MTDLHFYLLLREIRKDTWQEIPFTALAFFLYHKRTPIVNKKMAVCVSKGKVSPVTAKLKCPL
jgi:hypothetical protein